MSLFGPPQGEPFGFLTNYCVVLNVSNCVMTVAELTAAERPSNANMLKVFFIPTPPERSQNLVSTPSRLLPGRLTGTIVGSSQTPVNDLRGRVLGHKPFILIDLPICLSLS